MGRTWLRTLVGILIVALASADVEPDEVELAASKNDKVVVCYVASWASYRGGIAQFNVNSIKPDLCTHLIYSFAGLDNTTWTIKSLDSWKDIQEGGKGYYRAMTDLKSEKLKVSLAIGGYNEGWEKYSHLAQDSRRRKTFIASVLDFLAKYNFDGLDIDWEFPKDSDKKTFVLLVKELREAFAKKGYLLTAATSANPSTLNKGYDLVELSKYLDYLHIMAYDYHGVWDARVLPNAPLIAADGLSVDDTVSYFLNQGVPPEKIVLGLPMYGRTFTLVNELTSGDSPIGKPCTDKGFKGPYTNEEGFMGYNEICKELTDKSNEWQIGWDFDSSTSYMVNGQNVVVYDNPKSILEKVKYAVQKGLAGGMVWSMDTDDFRDYCSGIHENFAGTTVETDFPLMRAINSGFGRSLTEVETTTTPRKKKKRRKNSSPASFSVSLALMAISVAALGWF